MQVIIFIFNTFHRESPTVKKCFEEMQKTLGKRNIRINSINFSSVEKTSTSDSDSSELNTTVISNVPSKANEAEVPAAK